MTKPSFHSGPAYKFISTESFKLILTNETLRFTRGDSFNDPFESNPYLVPIDWKGLVKEDKSNIEFIKNIANEAFLKICSNIYITCFSKTYLDAKSHLMWSHYADSHKGLCFEIIFPELNQENYKEGDIVPIDVTYCENLFEERSKLTTESEDLPLYMATYKSNIWEYENEVRLVLHSQVFDRKKFNLVNNNKNADVVFNIENISKVIFGAKSSPKEIKSIVKQCCLKGHLPEFYRIDLNPITLEFYEYRLPIKDEVLAYNHRKKQKYKKMTAKELSELTDQELLQEAKKMKSNLITNAVFIGFLIGIIFYSVMKNSLGFLTLIPLFFAYKLINKPNHNKELEAILKERNLK